MFGRYINSAGIVPVHHRRRGRQATLFNWRLGWMARGAALMLSMAGCESSGVAPELACRVERALLPAVEGTRAPAPRGLHAATTGELYALDTIGRVLVYAEDGSFRRKWNMPESDVGRPEGICRLSDGRIAVADTHYHRVILFDEEGREVGRFGEHGSGPGQFVYPVRLTQDDSGFLYVCEYGENDRVQKFTADGEFVLSFGSRGAGPGQFQRPSGIAWHDGRLYVTDAFNNRIQVFDEGGRFQGLLGGEQAPELHYPYDIAASTDGVLWVVEYGAGRISAWSVGGNCLGRFGSIGSGDGQFRTPWGLAWKSPHRLFVADTGNRRVVELTLPPLAK